jgi:hypothetical protein
MANETVLSGLVSQTDVVNGLITPEFEARAMMIALGTESNIEAKSQKFTQRNGTTASTVAEGATATKAVITQTGTTVSPTKQVAYNEITKESLKFAGVGMTAEGVAVLQATALQRNFDSTALGLVSGFTNSAVATSTLDFDTIFEGVFNVDSADTPLDDTLACVLSVKQVFELKKDTTGSAGGAWANPDLQKMVLERPKANNFIGNIGGVDFYQSSLVNTDGGTPNRYEGILFHPRYAFAYALAGQPDTDMIWVPSKKTLEVVTDFFFGIGEWVDGAGCQIKSDV